MGVNWAAGLVRWQPHKSKEGRAYPLHHLHPFRKPFTLKATGKRPERTLELYFGWKHQLQSVAGPYHSWHPAKAAPIKQSPAL